MSGVIPSPNIWRYPAVYEVENRSVDPDGVLEQAMRAVRPWDGAAVLDIGCGSGYHLPRFARDAASVTGVEPHPPLVQLARRRVAALDDPDLASRIEVRAGTAQALPVPSNSIDVVHARWAYFFGPGCEPGLAEIRRVLKRGGVAFVIDNDATRSTFGRWFQEWLPKYDPKAVEAFWRKQGWTRVPLDIRWDMPTRADFEAVVRIEFSAEHAAKILASHPGSSVDYAVNLFWFEAPRGLWR
ncbi:class I SAM-dependent methyltransferase [Kineosporia succinea]|uniref:Ubiquinone/menaquinone biosynthesis C-methylase UbiE n=1 Tax=Kineosporia succinea TaxID=84632 RepID=A0ABT9P302_9ACTN|nr:class I SAM-dependent methyltransferase [Kineosporia succinea]MDP9827066.1 ubiquinone/menaquinone biosynthesis C-methylase UbiE [Kineosporia succinea]